MTLVLILFIFALVVLLAFWLFLRFFRSEKEPLCYFCFLDHTGQEIIPAHFENALDFSEGLAAVKINGLWGFIDTAGQLVIAPTYGRVRSFSGGLAAVKLDAFLAVADWGYINNQGEMVIPARFYDGGRFNQGLARVTLDFVDRDGFDTHQQGYIDTAGQVILEDPARSTYLEQSHFHADGRFPVALGGGVFGFWDRDGNLLANRSFVQVRSFSDGFAAVALRGNSPETVAGFVNELAGGSVEGPLVWGYIDTAGNWLIPASLGLAEDFHEGIALVNTHYQSKFASGHYLLIDTSGQQLPGSPFASAHTFSEGLAAVCNEAGEAWYIDWTGQRVLDLAKPYELLSGADFQGGLAKVAIKGPGVPSMEYFMDHQGQIVVSFPTGRYIKTGKYFAECRLLIAKVVDPQTGY